ncbi:Lrp/AsnC family transcriptional regulator [Candidatus Bathyarchaeota archaeon]|nr:Lrp/AsnC family transcriptional regulator [Candidatus Bathyarchaeota archaeon]NIR17560.1 Lrp/AsnC family transcriptional regulator [Desulfobacterales bacterium]NIU81249.1 Lrp/AsnC family transcriptional regulator [Candidatus Bathyarchaeota archaeon]NIV67899.1 Lrp/AsnC family transcriptional regulator [Candidatus Bathyarchaeota archaeon]NIW16343.1 Lrp/AsnC family transcriptional regulator [Candidatus Bathyarchaeota archaeon]
MYRIFALVDTDPGKDKAVEKKLLKYDEVVELHYISGQYDLFAVIEINLHGKSIFSTVQGITQKFVQKIRMIDGVRDTNTIVPFLSLTKQAD